MAEDFQLRIRVDASEAVEGGRSAAEALGAMGAAGQKSQAQIAAGAKEATGSSRELRTVFRQLAREFPLLGMVGRALFSPLALGAAVATYAIRRLREDLQRLNEALTASAWRDYGSVVEAQREKLTAASLAADAHAAAMERLRAATQTASDASARLMDVYRARMSAEDRLDEARKRLESARVEATERDPVRRAEKLAEIEERYAARRRAREEEAKRFELAEQYRKAANEEVAARRAGREAEAARAAQAGLRSEAEITARLGVEKERLAQISEELEAKEARLEELRGMGWARRSTPQQMEMESLADQVEALGRQRELQRGIVGRLSARAPGEIAAWRRAGARVEMWEGAERGALERAIGIRAMLPTQEAVAGIESRARTAEAGLERGARIYGVTSEARQSYERLLSEITSTLERGNGVNAALLDKLRQYGERIATLEGQVKNLR
ncbi:MAG TPA: hypothetical protein P5169_02325 [Kiritimatiellia bacterium]|nr:hypothetical protein [Kiritimatiellia bacterium]